MMKVRIGSRESRLAVLQSQWVVEELRRIAPEVEVKLVTLTTTGEMLEKVEENALFAKKSDKALLEGEVDMMVHALDDMPMSQDPRLPIAAFLCREDPREVMVLRPGLEKFPFKGGIIGTSSKRRSTQIGKFYPTAEPRSVCGSIEDCMARLDKGEFDALILAAADLKRMGLEERMSRTFNIDQLIPAAGQGILAIQCRYDADLPFITQFGDEKATACAVAERAFVRTLGCGFDDPSTAHAQISETGILKMIGSYVTPEGEDKRAAIAGRPARAAEMGERLACQLRGDAL